MLKKSEFWSWALFALPCFPCSYLRGHCYPFTYHLPCWTERVLHWFITNSHLQGEGVFGWEGTHDVYLTEICKNSTSTYHRIFGVIVCNWWRIKYQWSPKLGFHKGGNHFNAAFSENGTCHHHHACHSTCCTTGLDQIFRSKSIHTLNEKGVSKSPCYSNVSMDALHGIPFHVETILTCCDTFLNQPGQTLWEKGVSLLVYTCYTYNTLHDALGYHWKEQQDELPHAPGLQVYFSCGLHYISWCWTLLLGTWTLTTWKKLRYVARSLEIALLLCCYNNLIELCFPHFFVPQWS